MIAQTPEPAGVRRRTARHAALIANSLIHAINDGYVAAMYPVLPLIAAEFGAGYAEAGLVKLGLSGALGAFQLPAGLLAEKTGELLVLGAGTIGLAGSFLALGLAGAFWQIVLLALVGGAAAAGQHPLSTSLVARDYVGKERSSAIGTLNFAGDVGKAALPLVWGWLAVTVGWRQAMLWTGLIGLPLVGAFVLLSRGSNRTSSASTKTQQSEESAGWGITDGRRFALVSVIGILDSVVRGGALALLAFLLIGKGFDTPTAASTFTVIFVAGALGKLGCGPLGARFGPAGVVAVTEAATAIAVLAFVPVPPAGVFALAVVFGFFLNGTSTVLYTAVAEVVAIGRQARGYALYYTLTLVASAVAPVVYGVAADRWGLPVTFILLGATAALTVPLAPLLAMRSRALASEVEGMPHVKYRDRLATRHLTAAPRRGLPAA
jgi:MFS transporter, FSR family, fosmidomycin resistance protein